MAQLKVLLIDDEESFAFTLAKRLSFRNIETQAFTCFNEEALKCVRERKLDLVLLDVNMPGISGVEIMERIKTVKPQMKFIFISGVYSEQETLQDMGKTADGYLVKPIDINDLIKKIKEVVGSASR